MAELGRLLTGGQGPAVITQTITGLGGIGKTQTALAYAYRHLADYRLVWWLRAESAATLATDFATLAEPLGLDPATAEQDKLLKEIRQARQALQATGDWLLILDNVEDPKIPRKYLPTTGFGHVLITSRRTDWYGIARALPLQLMPEPEALQLLGGRLYPEALPTADLAEAKALAQDLGYLPLALAQARAYTAETGKSLAAYHKLFTASRPAMFKKEHPNPAYPASIAKTWQISIDAAAAACPASRPLLEILAFFAPAALSTATLAANPADLYDLPQQRAALPSVKAPLPEGLRDELERDAAVRELNRFSLIRAEADSITVHRLVQAVTRDSLGKAMTKARAKAAIELVNAALSGPPWEPTNWPTIRALLPHTLAVAETAERLKTGLRPAARVLNEIAVYHQVHAAFAEAEPLHQRALKIREVVLGAEHPNTAESLNNLARLYQDQGRLSEAEPLFQRALAICERALGAEHLDTASCLNNLASLYQAQGRLSEATSLFQRALAIRKAVLGAEHPKTAESLNNLASLYWHQGQLNKAALLFERALKIVEALGAEHPVTAQTLNNLAVVYRALGRLNEAAPLLQRALAIRKAVLGTEHPSTAESLNSLARLYQDQGRLSEAVPLHQRALKVREAVLGPEHPDTAISLNNLARLYQDQGRLSEAEPLFQRALAICERALGADHPITRTARKNLAMLRQILSALPPDRQPPK